MMALEWPAGCGLSLEARREIESEHERGQIREAVQNWRTCKVDELARENASLRRRIAKLEKLTAAEGPLVEGLAKYVSVRLAEEQKKTQEWLGQELERRAVMRDAGIWSAEKEYRPGDLTTFKGGGWVCKVRNTGVRPGDGGGWRLALKSNTGPTVV